MGYSYVFLGDLRFPNAAQKAAWRSSALDGARFDSPKDWRYGKGDETAGDALAYFRGELCALTEDIDALTLRAVVDKGGDEFGEGRKPLVCAFRQAADFGGEGTLTVVGYMDYPGTFGLRATASQGASTCEELDDDEATAVEDTDAYREADALVAAMVAKHAPPGGYDQVLEDIAAQRAADGAVIAQADDMTDVFRKLPGALPSSAIYTVRDWLPTSPLVKALVGRRDKDASARMWGHVERRVTKEKPTDDDLLAAFVLMHALWERGDFRSEVMAVWIEHPSWFLRDHELARKLGGREADARLVALLGVQQGSQSTENHRWIVDALFDSQPENAAALASKLLDGERRGDAGRLESLRWIVSSFYEHPERRSPAWEEFFVRLTTTGPDWSEHAYDVYDQVRANAIGVLALWRLPQALPLIRDHFARLGVERATELLVALGDPAAIPVLEAQLAEAKRKPDRARLQKAIASLGGEPAPAVAEASEHVIEVASSGRAGCRGCKEKIPKGELRFGEAVPNRFADTEEPTMRWYHLRCAAGKRPKLLGPVLAAYTGSVPDRAALEATLAEAAKPKKRKK